ncbi:MAG: alpha/beta fold hydrolase [bacterium]
MAGAPPQTLTHTLSLGEGESVLLDWTPPAAPDGPWAVFVHGLGSNRRGDKALYFTQRFAANGWGFMTVDLRGHGDSGGGMHGLTLSRCLADLAAALDWVRGQIPGAPPPVLIGSSMGGAVAAWQHIAHPKETGPLVFIAPSLQFPGSLAWKLGPAALEAWRREGARVFESDWIRLEIGFSMMEDALDYDPQRLLKGFAAPALIFHGMKDDAVDWRSSLTFVEDCPYPRLELVLLKHGDHRLTDHKAFMFDTLWCWLEGLKEGGGG